MQVLILYCSLTRSCANKRETLTNLLAPLLTHKPLLCHVLLNTHTRTHIKEDNKDKSGQGEFDTGIKRLPGCQAAHTVCIHHASHWSCKPIMFLILLTQSILLILSLLIDLSGAKQTGFLDNLIRQTSWQTSRPWRGCLHSARPAWWAPWLAAGWADGPSSTGTPGRPASLAQARLARRWAGTNELETHSMVGVTPL